MLKIRKKYVALAIIILVFWMGIFPLILSNTVTLLCKNFSSNSRYEISVSNPKFQLYPLPVIKFSADTVNIKNRNTSDELNVNKFKTKLRLLPLLSGRVHLNKLQAQSLYIKKGFKKNLTLNEDILNQLKNTRFRFDSVYLKNYDCTFTSEGTDNSVKYNGKDLKFVNKNRSLNLNIDSTLKTDKPASKIYINFRLPKNSDINKTNFNVEISNLDIEPLGEFLINFLPKEIDGLKGHINIYANKDKLIAELRKVKILYKNKNHSVIFPEKFALNSKFNINKNEITLNNAEINSDKLHITADGKIRDYIGKAMPFIDMKVIINKSRIEDFVEMLPPFKVEDFDSYKLKEYKFYGNVIGNLALKGRFPEPNITGGMYIDDGILIKPIPNTNKGAVIKLSFTGRHVNYNVYVPAGNRQTVVVKGNQELYNIKYADISIKSSQNVNLHSARDVVNPLHEIFNFIIGPVPILDVYGTGNIDLTVKGNRTNPHAWGTLNFYNASANFLGIPDLKLKEADAILSFNDTGAVFKTLKGSVNEKDFKIKGTCNLNGNFNFDVESEGQPSQELYTAVQTSTMLEDIKKLIPKTDKIIGTADLKLKIYGTVKKIEDLKFNKNAFAKGTISLKDNEILISGMNINKANATVEVDGTASNTVLTGLIGDSPLNITAKVKNNIADVTAKIPKLNLNSLIEDSSTREKEYLPYISLDLRYKGNSGDVEYDKVIFNSAVIPNTNSNTCSYKSGKISMEGAKLSIKNLDFYIHNPNNSVNADLQISDVFSKNPIFDGVIKLKLPDIKVLNEIFDYRILPKNLTEILKNYEFEKGSLNLNARFNNGKLSTETSVAGIAFNYIPLEIPVEVVNGKLIIRNDDLKLQSLNILVDQMPLLLDGEIKNITDKQIFSIYLNSKPKQEFIDKFLNKNAIYPLKIKGDIVYSAQLKGSPEEFDIDAKINMAKDYSIYYYGATVGDVENAITLTLDSKIFNGKELKIKEFLYDKVIDSQSGKQTRLNMLRVKGGINFIDNDTEFRDLYIKTSNPTDARIFNLIFGKPNIKQGQFTSDLRMRGKLSDPRIFGGFHIVETNIPFMDTTMKNIEFIFKDRFLEIKSKGEVFGNDISAEAILKNKLTKPYHIEKAFITTKDMDLNRIVNKIKSVEAEITRPQDSFGNFDVNSVIVNNLKIKADNIILRNIHATNFEADAGLNEQHLFEMKNFLFNIAKGKLSGNYSYNLTNNDITLNMDADNISANEITWAIFDLRNQIYGDLTGKTNLSCNGDSFEKCMQTLNGDTSFNVKNGRMPKLGSLEYLLKAGNLIKGGITSLSINSVIDLISPVKTGEFSDIYGNISIKDGIAKNIEITTQGKDLSLFICGTYNFSTSIADMEVLGLLSRKISTMLGPIGNVSVNTLFNLIPGLDLSKDNELLQKINKIPGLEITNTSFRKFLAVIKGNINGDDYVTSFKWIN